MSTDSSNPIRVAFVIPQLHGGGRENQALRTANRLARSPELELLAITRSLQPGRVKEKLDDALQFRELERRTYFDFAQFTELRSALHEFTPNITVAWAPQDQPWVSIGVPNSSKLVFNFANSGVQDEVTNKPFPFREYLFPRIFKDWAELYFFNSRIGMQNWSRLCHLPRDRCFVRPNYLDMPEPVRLSPERTGELREELNISSADRVIACVGRLELPIKGQDLLLQAMPEVLDHHPEALLLLVGDGGSRGELENLADELDISGRVRFAGWRDRPEELLALSEVFCLPSRSEGFCNALVEAMVMEIPCAAADVGAVPELLDHGRVGELCEPGSVEELGSGILHLLDTPQRSREVGRRGAELTRERFEPERVARMFVEVFLRLAAGKRISSHSLMESLELA